MGSEMCIRDSLGALSHWQVWLLTEGAATDLEEEAILLHCMVTSEFFGLRAAAYV